MPRKTTDEKLDARLLFSLSGPLLSDLERVAAQNDCSVQELLRRAARAIVRCQEEHGEVPMDMELSQRRIGAGPSREYDPNEAPARHAAKAAAAARLRKAEREASPRGERSADPK